MNKNQAAENKADGEIRALGNALREIVRENGAKIYGDRQKLGILLQEKQVSSLRISQIELFLEFSSFLKYMDQFSGGITAIDINNILLTARRTGLTDPVNRVIVEILLDGLGIVQTLGREEILAVQEKPLVKGGYICPSEFESELEEIRERIVRAAADGGHEPVQYSEILSKEQMDFLTTCSRAGVPRAAGILGEMYLKSYQESGAKEDESRALELLNLAYSKGNTAAMELLGDYYFQKAQYDEAYATYTGMCSLAVSEERRDNVRLMRKAKEHNRRQNRIWWLLAALLELLVLFVIPDSAITGSHALAKVFFTILNAGTVALCVLRERKLPFRDSRETGVLLAVIFAVFSFSYLVL